MSRITYGVSEEIYVLGDSKRTAYGLVAYADAELDGTAIIAASARDITSSRERAEELAATCNRLGLSLLRFDDVIEDFLS